MADSLRVDTAWLVPLLNTYKTHQKAENHEQAEATLRRIDSIGKSLGEAQWLKGGLFIANQYYNQFQNEQALEVYTQLVAAAVNTNDSTALLVAQYRQGMCFKSLGVVNKALRSFYSAKALATRLGNDQYRLLALIQIGNTKKSQGLQREAIDAYEEVLMAKDALLSDDLRASTYNNMGSAYKLMGDYARAKEYFLKAIDINKKTENLRFLSYNYNNLANIYEETNELETALQYHERSLELKQRLNDFPSMAVSLGNLAIVYAKMERPNEALKYLEEAIALAEQYRVGDLLVDIYTQYAEQLAARGRVQEAYAAMVKQAHYADSLSKLDRRAIIDDLEDRYAQQVIEDENAELRKNIESSEAEIFRKDVVLFAFTLCLVLMSVVLIMYYLSHRSRTEASSKLIEQNAAITSQKERIERQKEAIEQQAVDLERIRKDKELFFSTISHDMRGPLGAISAVVSIMQQRDEHDTDELQVLHYSSQVLLALIEDILDFSNLESGRLRIEAKPFDLSATLSETARTFAFVANEKQIDLLINVPDQPILLVGDAKRLSQVVFNLVSNAIKFTREGFVKISLEGHGNENSSVYSIVVEDTGVGIPAERLTAIFEKFEQASNEVYRDFGGYGLGLFIAKNIVERMDGRIEVSSVVNEGTRFKVTVPLAKPGLV